eukprot:CAMPEP_0194289292 /NCGR_PEP_ID=MMETSP0169-20130528/38761_1 /TAXON_ID=218684 /ORGANISM="Corethron pennatum, Strain L29A3" /LENGTH=454 /DNA_ID=CAMNT_0039036529 /DNA_START=13 /DNA_END=1374 /DNA_ORIENTATION=+
MPPLRSRLATLARSSHSEVKRSEDGKKVGKHIVISKKNIGKSRSDIVDARARQISQKLLKTKTKSTIILEDEKKDKNITTSKSPMRKSRSDVTEVRAQKTRPTLLKTRSNINGWQIRSGELVKHNVVPEIRSFQLTGKEDDSFDSCGKFIIEKESHSFSDFSDAERVLGDESKTEHPSLYSKHVKSNFPNNMVSDTPTDISTNEHYYREKPKMGQLVQPVIKKKEQKTSNFHSNVSAHLKKLKNVLIPTRSDISRKTSKSGQVIITDKFRKTLEKVIVKKQNLSDSITKKLLEEDYADSLSYRTTSKKFESFDSRDTEEAIFNVSNKRQEINHDRNRGSDENSRHTIYKDLSPYREQHDSKAPKRSEITDLSRQKQVIDNSDSSYESSQNVDFYTLEKPFDKDESYISDRTYSGNLNDSFSSGYSSDIFRNADGNQGKTEELKMPSASSKAGDW